MKKIFVALLLVSINSFTYAQTDFDEKKAINSQIEYQIDMLDYHLAYLLNKETNDNIKADHIDAALELFIENGISIRTENNEKLVNPSRIEFIDEHTGFKKSYPVNYLKTLPNFLQNKKKIKVQQARIYILKILKKVSIDECEASLECMTYPKDLNQGCSISKTEIVRIPQIRDIQGRKYYIYFGDIQVVVR
ncbi:MAG: hypothetical protein IJ756_06465 [Paludibacteraceae bacterium]|nr:hypothetical protein [Paludibacteraceae bacterium]